LVHNDIPPAEWQRKPDVWTAYLNCDPLPLATEQWLLAHNLPITAIKGPRPVLFAKIKFEGAYAFEFDPYGEPAILLPAFEDNDLVDIVAWRNSRLASWNGRVNALGWSDLYAPNLTGDPLKVWASPLGWLKANRTGMTPINVEAWARSLFYRGDHVAAFVTEDPAHGLAIKGAFNRRAPRVLVPELKIVEAA